MNTEIIVINQNGKHLLDDCFSSILQTTLPNVIITLMDNGSTDNSVDFVKTKFPSVKLLLFKQNKGFAGGYDLAIRQSKAETIIMLNNDIKVLDGWFEPLIAPLSNPKVAITGSQLLQFDQPNIVDHAGGKISISGGGIDTFKKQFKSTENQNQPSAYACGAAMAFKKSTYINLGGFDSDYVIYHEDVDLGWKANLAGLQVVYVPSSQILHKVSASMGNFESPRRLYLSQRNRMMNLFKNAGIPLLIRGMAANLAFDLVRIVSWLIQFKFNNIFSLLYADLSFSLSIFSKIKQRYFVQNILRKVKDEELIEKNLIAGLLESLTAYRNLKK